VISLYEGPRISSSAMPGQVEQMVTTRLQVSETSSGMESAPLEEVDRLLDPELEGNDCITLVQSQSEASRDTSEQSNGENSTTGRTEWELLNTTGPRAGTVTTSVPRSA
jgi:hypothetical protein